MQAQRNKESMKNRKFPLEPRALIELFIITNIVMLTFTCQTSSLSLAGVEAILASGPLF